MDAEYFPPCGLLQSDSFWQDPYYSSHIRTPAIPDSQYFSGRRNKYNEERLGLFFKDVDMGEPSKCSGAICTKSSCDFSEIRWTSSPDSSATQRVQDLIVLDRNRAIHDILPCNPSLLANFAIDSEGKVTSTTLRLAESYAIARERTQRRAFYFEKNALLQQRLKVLSEIADIQSLLPSLEADLSLHRNQLSILDQYIDSVRVDSALRSSVLPKALPHLKLAVNLSIQKHPSRRVGNIATLILQEQKPFNAHTTCSVCRTFSLWVPFNEKLWPLNQSFATLVIQQANHVQHCAGLTHAEKGQAATLTTDYMIAFEEAKVPLNTQIKDKLTHLKTLQKRLSSLKSRLQEIKKSMCSRGW